MQKHVSHIIAAAVLVVLGSSGARAVEEAAATEAGAAQKQFGADQPRMTGTVTQDTSATDRLNAIISKSGNTQWDRLNKLGTEAYDHFKFTEAQTHFLAAIRELKKTNQRDDRLVLSRNNLGDAYLADGKHMDAIDAFELAFETEKELSKVGTAEGGRTLDGLAMAYKGTGNYKRAEQLFKQALQIRQSAVGATSAEVAETLTDLGELYRAQKLYDNAEPVYKLALETYSKTPGVPELKLAYALDKMGTCYHEQGKIDDAKKLFATALSIKDKHSTFYTPTDARNLGLVYYRCLDGAPDSYHAFTRGVEAEFINVKDVSAVATLTAEIFSRDWWLMKATVTVRNGGKSPVSALAMAPTLKLESPKVRKYTPLDSGAIAAELDARGTRLFNSVLHSADYRYIADSIVAPGVMAPGLGFIGGFPALAHFSPDWQARIDARNNAMRIMANTLAAEDRILRYKPGATTIAPGETETFIIYYPYCKFTNATLKILLGNSVIEFPFTDKSG